MHIHIYYVCMYGMHKQYEYKWIPFLFHTSVQKPQASLSEKLPTSYSPIPDYSVKLLFPDHKCNIWPSLDSDNKDKHTTDFASIL